MNFTEDDEMNDAEIKLKFGAFISEAIQAFVMDASYAADLAKKAKLIEIRRAKRKV